MNANPTAPSPIDLELFRPLDGTDVPGSWRPKLAGALVEVGTRPLVDQQILPRLTTLVRTHQAALRSVSAGSTSLILPIGAQHKHPVAIALLGRNSEKNDLPVSTPRKSVPS